ncbi:hypothetical protein CF327_g358 [Tilletia walkeri]|nr:hypothetical protein CF327_g358 [Tilletia walkeri]
MARAHTFEILGALRYVHFPSQLQHSMHRMSSGSTPPCAFTCLQDGKTQSSATTSAHPTHRHTWTTDIPTRPGDQPQNTGNFRQPALTFKSHNIHPQDTFE